MVDEAATQHTGPPEPAWFGHVRISTAAERIRFVTPHGAGQTSRVQDLMVASNEPWTASDAAVSNRTGRRP